MIRPSQQTDHDPAARFDDGADRSRDDLGHDDRVGDQIAHDDVGRDVRHDDMTTTEEDPGVTNPSAAVADSGATPEQLIPQQRAADYRSRWDAVKGDFVDEPRQAVAGADELVGELLEELQSLFHNQRQDIEQGIDSDTTSTEDLRLALRRYRSFFDRLLSV